jgi:hypothetical protein
MNKRQVTITITVDDLMEYFECSEQEAIRIWDDIDEERDLAETLDEAAMEEFVILMYDYKRRNNHA